MVLVGASRAAVGAAVELLYTGSCDLAGTTEQEVREVLGSLGFAPDLFKVADTGGGQGTDSDNDSVETVPFSPEKGTKRRRVAGRTEPRRGEKTHRCYQCNKTFAQAGTLKRHMLVHTGEMPHRCNICNKAFARSGSLKQHMLVHKGEKPHICYQCNKAFAEAGTLKRHMLVHTGEKSHTCDLCDGAFARLGDLKQHMRKMHKG